MCCYLTKYSVKVEITQFSPLPPKNLVTLKGQFTPKSKVHIFPLTCTAIYQFRLLVKGKRNPVFFFIRENRKTFLVPYKTWSSSALQPLVADMSITKTNTLKKSCFHG